MAELTPKEQYEARRKAELQEREQAPTSSQAPKKNAGRFIWWGIALLILGGIGYALYSAVKAEIPKTPDQSKAFDIVSREHIPETSPRPTTYNSNPPTSGPHFAVPAPVGFYAKELSDMKLVHNLEHGDVWISFKGSISSSSVEKLKGLLDGAKVIITRRDSNDTDVAAAAWGRLDGFNFAGATISEDELQRLQDFILRYKNRGPESVLDSASMLPAAE
jgi:hypothetical protein